MITNNLKVFGAGLLISGLGALPLGTLNVTAFNIAASQGFQKAILFSLAVIIVELVYVRLSLISNQKLIIDGQWTGILLLFGAVFLGYLGLTSFLSSNASIANDHGLFFKTGLHSPIALGILLSALNPLQFPFWLAWNKVLTSKKVLRDNSIDYSFYMLGIGVGTFLALALFIWFGHTLLTNYNNYTFYTNKILGTMYFGFSIYLLLKYYRRRLKPLIK